MPALALVLLQSQADIARAQAMVPAVFAGMFIVGLILLALVIIPLWVICKKAGLSPWLSLIVLFPGFGILILLYVLAFAEWKVAPAAQPAWAQPYPPIRRKDPCRPRCDRGRATANGSIPGYRWAFARTGVSACFVSSSA